MHEKKSKERIFAMREKNISLTIDELKLLKKLFDSALWITSSEFSAIGVSPSVFVGLSEKIDLSYKEFCLEEKYRFTEKFFPQFMYENILPDD